MDCVNGACHCETCGRTIDLHNAYTGVGYHTCKGNPAAGLGDIVAAGLAAVGITKERAQAVAQAVGIKDCKCAGRQAALNRLGQRLGLPPGRS